MTKLAVFDWNGTIFDDLPANVGASNACFGLFGLQPLSTDDYLATFTFPIIHFYVKNGVSADEYLARMDEAGACFQTTYSRLSAACSIRPEAPALFDWLLDQGYRLIILSNYLKDRVAADLARFHIAHYFTEILANDAFSRHTHTETNKIERMEAYLRVHGIAPEDAFIVGDSLEEIDVGRHLGMRYFSITGGSVGADRLKAVNPTHLIDNLAEIRTILSTSP